MRIPRVRVVHSAEKEKQPVQGVISIHKPKGPTSHDVVDNLRRLAKTRRVGHAGTLDPMAEGVLLCCLGAATRVVPWLIGLPKEYTGEITLGARSDTYDALGKIVPVADPSHVTLEDLQKAFRAQEGMIEQIPPPYSAVKVGGKKLYEYARKGEKPPVKIRTVWIERFEVVRYFPPKVLFLARVGSGAYVRSMAHAAGETLGCGAYLSSLCRTRVGGFDVANAVSLEALEADPENLLPAALLPVSEALTHLAKVVLLPDAETRLRHGNPFRTADVMECGELPPAGRPVLVCSRAGEALAVAQSDAADQPFRPLCVLQAEP